MSKTATPKILYREQWLNEMANALSPHFKTCGATIPKNLRISCSWPANRGTANRNRTIGQCWHSECSSDKHHEIFVSPTLADPIEVGETLVHEIAHAALPKGAGHKAPFAKLAKSLGLEGKPTATSAGDELKRLLTKIAEELGEYPHGAIDVSGMPKQTTRLLKVVCPECGYTARVTRTWIDVGMPICPTCYTSFEEDYGQEIDVALQVSESHIEYHLKGEKRFAIRMTKSGKHVKWSVIDYEPEPIMLFGTVQARLTVAESRQDALDMIASLKEGLLTYADLDETVDDVDMDDFDPDDSETWTPTPEELAQDAADMAFLGDDEDEDPDYEDGNLDPEEEAARAMEQAKREAWVRV